MLCVLYLWQTQSSNLMMHVHHSTLILEISTPACNTNHPQCLLATLKVSECQLLERSSISVQFICSTLIDRLHIKRLQHQNLQTGRSSLICSCSNCLAFSMISLYTLLPTSIPHIKSRCEYPSRVLLPFSVRKLRFQPVKINSVGKPVMRSPVGVDRYMEVSHIIKRGNSLWQTNTSHK